ncbi:MAG: hypothetical protein V4617_03345 [Gemmatimonadota bacterium]
MASTVRAGQRPAVIRGQFTSGARVNWAAECGNAVVVLTLGTVVRADSIAPRGNGLQTASPAYIRRHHAAYGVVAETLGLGPIRRDGVEVLIGDCCSLIYYWDGRRWRDLPGAD